MTSPQNPPRTERLTIDGCAVTVRYAAAPADARLELVRAALLSACPADSHICASDRDMGECGHLK